MKWAVKSSQIFIIETFVIQNISQSKNLQKSEKLNGSFIIFTQKVSARLISMKRSILCNHIAINPFPVSDDDKAED